MTVNIVKRNGDVVPFDPLRVKKSILRAGASEEIVSEVMARVIPRVQEGMMTREIYKIAHEELKKADTCFACRFNLRPAILKFGPAGFLFEKYVAAILKGHHYEAHVPEHELQGSCVRHEVDVIAEKDGRRVFIEAKFRNDYRDSVNLKDTMATWSRFLDLVDGAAVGKCEHLDEVWIVTNARFSDRAKQFGVCKGVNMIGWNFPPERSFASLVDHTMLYPVTVIDDLTQSEIDRLAEADLMLCKEVAEIEPEDLARRIDVSLERAQELVEISSKVSDSSHGHSNSQK